MHSRRKMGKNKITLFLCDWYEKVLRKWLTLWL